MNISQVRHDMVKKFETGAQLEIRKAEIIYMEGDQEQQDPVPSTSQSKDTSRGSKERKHESQGTDGLKGTASRSRKSSSSTPQVNNVTGYARQVISKRRGGYKTPKYELCDCQIIKPLAPINSRGVADLPRLGSIYHLPDEVREPQGPDQDIYTGCIWETETTAQTSCLYNS
jgi:hypothetical protein